MPEELTEILGATRLDIEHGDKFQGWYMIKTPQRKANILLDPIEFKDLSYQFDICDYNFRFIMPAQIKFSGGVISYSQAERELGVFRFPQDDGGRFCTPLDWKDLQKRINNMTSEDVEKLLKNRKVLVFEAFRIPQQGFEYFSLSNFQLKEIEQITTLKFVEEIKTCYEQNLHKKIEAVKEKISSLANYLLIVTELLNGERKDFEEVSVISNGIIHI